MSRSTDYEFPVPLIPRVATGVLVAAGFLFSAPPTLAGGANQDVPSSVSSIREELITIGARGGRERTAVDSAVPVDAFDLEQLAAGGQTEVARMLQMAAPSFNFSTSTISDGTDIVRPATLRGMQPDQTLVLVNGKRRHNSALMHVNGSIGRGTAGVDLNAIPASSIKRIEVLRDGAAAQYGSDAIAGVINVVLKDQTETIDPFIQYGQTFESDGENVLGSINAGFPILGEGFINATLEYRDRSATNRAGLDKRQQFNFQEQVLGQAQLGLNDCVGGCTYRADEPNPASDPQGVNNHRYGDPDSENLYFYWNAAIPIGRTELYTFGGIAQRGRPVRRLLPSQLRRALGTRDTSERLPAADQHRGRRHVGRPRAALGNADVRLGPERRLWRERVRIYHHELQQRGTRPELADQRQLRRAHHRGSQYSISMHHASSTGSRAPSSLSASSSVTTRTNCSPVN